VAARKRRRKPQSAVTWVSGKKYQVEEIEENLMGRLLEKLASGERIAGTNDSIGGLPMAEVLAVAGLDFACLDTMFCAFDWSQIQAWSRGALMYGMDPVVRLPAHPWVGGEDQHILAEVGRAFGIGLTGVCVSVNTPEEVGRLLDVSHTWHKNLHLHHFENFTENYDAYATSNADSNVLIPLIESHESIEKVDRILKVDGLRAVWLGLSDVSRMLDVPLQYEHQKVWDFIDRAVEAAEGTGVAILANAGYEASTNVEALRERADRLFSHGIRGLWLQNTGYVVQWLYRTVLGAMSSDSVKTGA
jgi:2-keto-3-deoxy-L-rhamnonate aldolase RhmA